MKKNNIATVIVTDIVGYSKLTGKNQELALELLAEHDKIILQSIKSYKGTVLVNRGDGFVAMFLNHSNAIICSMNIQNEIKNRNKFNIKSRKFNIRIGIHTGNYFQDNTEYYGECIDISSLLEPLAPSGGILISHKLNSLIEFDSNIYTRKYGVFDLNKKNEATYIVYLNLIDWYLDKKNKLESVDEKKYIKKSHELYHNCDYSGCIKFSNSILETTKKTELRFENLGFLCNSFISLGQLTYAKKLLNLIKNTKSNKLNLELNAHFLKLEAHILFNKKHHSKSDLLYKKSYKLLKDTNSKYSNEILFFTFINLFLSKNLNIDNFNDVKLNSSNDEYDFLVRCLELIVSNKETNLNGLIKEIENIKNKQFQSYGYWFLSKYYSQINCVDESYKYETLSQEAIKTSSYSISDPTLRDNYLKSLLIHRKILTETSAQIDDLIDIDNDLDNIFLIDKSYNEENIFNYCVNCGKANVNSNIECESCRTNLKESYYQ